MEVTPDQKIQRRPYFQNAFHKRKRRSGMYVVNDDSSSQSRQTSEIPTSADGEEIDNGKTEENANAQESVGKNSGSRRGSIFNRFFQKFESSGRSDEKEEKFESMAQDERRSSLFTRVTEIMKMPPRHKSHQFPKSKKNYLNVFRRQSRQVTLEELRIQQQAQISESGKSNSDAPKRPISFREVINVVIRKTRELRTDKNLQKFENESPEEEKTESFQSRPSFQDRNGETEFGETLNLDEHEASTEANVVELSRQYQQQQLEQEESMNNTIQGQTQESQSQLVADVQVHQVVNERKQEAGREETVECNSSNLEDDSATTVGDSISATMNRNSLTVTDNGQETKPQNKVIARTASEIKSALLRWCQSKTKGYPHVSITNYSKSWCDGMAFCALIHHFHPDAFDFSKLDPKNRRENFELAFRTAEQLGDIAPLLEVDDMIAMGDHPEYKCVFTYVQQFYRRFHNVP